MKLRLILTFLITINVNSPLLSQEINCDKFDKFSAKYIECSAKKIKKKASGEIVKGKKKLDESGLGEQINKFKKSKTLSDLIKN